MKKIYEKIYEKKYKKAEKENTCLLKAAEYIVDHYCTTIDHKPLTGDDRKSVLYGICYDMRFGSEMTKNKYILIGIGIGCISSISVIALLKALRNKNRES